jgi:hypothetical protein
LPVCGATGSQEVGDRPDGEGPAFPCVAGHEAVRSGSEVLTEAGMQSAVGDDAHGYLSGSRTRPLSEIAERVGGLRIGVRVLTASGKRDDVVDMESGYIDPFTAEAA